METVGKREIWHSLRTESETEAFRRSHSVLAQIESTLATARSVVGKNVDQTLLEPWQQESVSVSAASDLNLLMPAGDCAVAEPITFGEVFEKFLADPTQDWSARTRLAYETTKRLRYR